MVKYLPESGFCYGVKTAVKKATELTDDIKAGRKVYLFGDLVNNDFVMGGFKAGGYRVTEDLDEIEPNSVVVIRAHGVPKRVYTALEEKVQIVDATCPDVKRILRLVEKLSEENGKKVVIIGKKQHPEVVGIHGWCADGRAVIVENETDLTDLNYDEPLAVVGQTTCNRAWWEKCVNHIEKKAKDVEIIDTLCDVTGKRMKLAAEMARECERMVVVGDKKSSNSVELYKTCLEVNPETVFISNLSELKKSADMFQRTKQDALIGLVGSASAPQDILDEIHAYLTFTDFLAEAKFEIEAESEKYLEIIKKSAENKEFIEAAVEDFKEQNRDGKRIRGALIKLGASLAGSSNWLPVAVAYEFFQTSILIHDDIIDKSPTRRGRATIHSKEENPHFGMSRAVCIGDYGLFLANKLLAESGLEPARLVKIFELFSRIQLTTLEGEIMDVSLP